MRGDGIDATARVDPTVRMGDGCQIGAGTTIAAGAYLQAGVTLGTDVTVGPNAVFVGRDFAERATSTGRADVGIVVGDGVSIGANATVLGGVTIEERAVVGAGAVVTRDVPAYAVVTGNPARIVGYASSPTMVPSRRIVASTLAPDELPLTVGRVVVRPMPVVFDLRGALSHGEFPAELPFVPQRYFLVYDVPSREVRGEHAHRALHELLVCVHGEVAVAVDDGDERGEIVLDRRDLAVHLPPMVWSRQYRFSPDAVLLVLASHGYDADDYLRDRDGFLAELDRSRTAGA